MTEQQQLEFPRLPLIDLETAVETTTTRVLGGGGGTTTKPIVTVVGTCVCACVVLSVCRASFTKASGHPASPPASNKYTSLCTDFWTTRCTRCPAALDAFDERAAKAAAASLASEEDPSNDDADVDVRYVSICCGVSCDGAREIIEQPDDGRRWRNVRHYFVTDPAAKEMAKKELGFASVPFYVVAVVAAGGNKGNAVVVAQKGKKIDWDDLVPGGVGGGAVAVAGQQQREKDGVSAAVVGKENNNAMPTMTSSLDGAAAAAGKDTAPLYQERTVVDKNRYGAAAFDMNPVGAALVTPEKKIGPEPTAASTAIYMNTNEEEQQQQAIPVEEEERAFVLDDLDF